MGQILVLHLADVPDDQHDLDLAAGVLVVQTVDPSELVQRGLAIVDLDSILSALLYAGGEV